MPVITGAVFYQQTCRVLCLLCWGLSISVSKNPYQFVIFQFSLAIANYPFLPTDFYFVRLVSQELFLLCFLNYFCWFISALQRLPANMVLPSCFILHQSYCSASILILAYSIFPEILVFYFYCVECFNTLK